MMQLVHVICMDINKAIRVVEGSEMFLLPMEKEEDRMGEMMVLLERILSILMENTCTGTIQTCYQEKVIGYVRIPLVEILTLLGELVVTTATRTGMCLKYTSPATVLADATSTLLHEGLREGLLVHQVTGVCQGR